MTFITRKKLNWWNKPLFSPAPLFSLGGWRVWGPDFLWNRLGVWSSGVWNWAGLGMCHVESGRKKTQGHTGGDKQSSWPSRPTQPLTAGISLLLSHCCWLSIDEPPEPQPFCSSLFLFTSSANNPSGFVLHPLTCDPSESILCLTEWQQAITSTRFFLPSQDGNFNRK